PYTTLFRSALVHQDLKQQLQRGALALKQGADRDERLDEDRAERVDLAEHRAVALARKQGVQHLLAHTSGLLERLVQLLFGLRGLRLQEPSFDDRRKVPVLERDLLEARIPPVEHVREAELLRARCMLADQLAQVALARDEADDRQRPVHARR